MQSKIALVSDFDGTISEDDFFTLVAQKYLTPQDLEPWNCYMQGRLTHFEALHAVFEKIHIPTKELDSFIKTIPIDEHFEGVAKFCRQNQIPLYICSAGCDYYIKILLAHLFREYNIHLVSNSGQYSEQTGLEMTAPSDGPFYDKNVGISKADVVKFLQNQGHKVIYCGDGPPDVKPAEIADVVFAKKYLLQKCKEAKIVTQPFRSFQDVLSYLKGV